MAGAAHDPWLEDDQRRETTITDLDLTTCLTRLQILAVLGGGPHDVTHVAAATDVSVTLASGHLARLARVGLVEFERQGGHHVYRLSGRTRIEGSPAGLRITATASDGCESSVLVSWTSAAAKMLGIVPAVTVKAAPVPAPSLGARSGPRRPSEPG